MKLLWKLKGLIAFVLLVGGVVLFLKFSMDKAKKADAALVAPNVAAANRLVDKEPDAKLDVKVKPQAELSEWVEITGTFASSNDRDRFLLAVPAGVNAYEIQTWRTVGSRYNYDAQRHEGGKLSGHTGMLGGNQFPISIISVDAKGAVLTQRLLAASGGGAELPAGTAKIEVVISGTSEDPYSSGLAYAVYLKGTTKATRTR
jgi:hypothetical protein